MDSKADKFYSCRMAIKATIILYCSIFIGYEVFRSFNDDSLYMKCGPAFGWSMLEEKVVPYDYWRDEYNGKKIALFSYINELHRLDKNKWGRVFDACRRNVTSSCEGYVSRELGDSTQAKCYFYTKRKENETGLEYIRELNR